MQRLPGLITLGVHNTKHSVATRHRLPWGVYFSVTHYSCLRVLVFKGLGDRSPILFPSVVECSPGTTDDSTLQ